MTTFIGPHGDAEDHLARLRSQGRDVRVVGPVSGGVDKATVLEAFATGLDLPGWFGHNWDALVDALRDVQADGGEVIELVWDHVAALRDEDHETFETVLDVLEQVQDERDDLRVTVIAR
ncbi:MAG: Barstar (barnase inhibitor) [Humibacillus sp.]|nr:Barstar (barnase inhibitor) [Humibacillus sp.]